MYRLTNNAAGPRVVYNAANRPVNIQPGETSAPMEINERALLGLRRDPRIEINEVSDTYRQKPVETPAPAPAPAPATPAPAGPAKGVEDEVANKDNTPAAEPTASELIHLAGDKSMHYPEWLQKARAVIGEDKWPGGTPKKSDVLALLREQAEA